MDETGPGELMDLSSRRPTRKLVRFDPTVSTGMLLQIGVLISGGVMAYGTYQADRAVQKMQVDIINRDVVEVKANLKEMQQSLVMVNQTLAVIQSRQQQQQSQAPR